MAKSPARNFFSKPSTWLGLLFFGLVVWLVWIVVKALGMIEQDYAQGLSATEQFAGNIKSSLPSWLGGDSGSSGSSTPSSSHWYNPFSWFSSSGSSSTNSTQYDSSNSDNGDTSTN